MINIHSCKLYSYKIPLLQGGVRSGIILGLKIQNGNQGWGEVSPLPALSHETLNDALAQLKEVQTQIGKIEWTLENFMTEIQKMNLLPSVSFGMESALMSLLDPVKEMTISTSALLMGSLQQILEQSEFYHAQGFTTVKLKIRQLSFDESEKAIRALQDRFRIRVDVNRLWNTKDSLKFFSKFPKDLFEYVEEPFANPKDLHYFTHALAIDESFPSILSLDDLKKFPNLKALIYKPMIQGGLATALPLWKWSKNNGVEFVLSSSFESDIGLSCIGLLASRLPIQTCVGLGTYHFMSDHLCNPPLHLFKNGSLLIKSQTPNLQKMIEV